MLWASIDNDDSLDLDQLSVAEPLADGRFWSVHRQEAKSRNHNVTRKWREFACVCDGRR